MPVVARSGTRVWQRRERGTQLAIWFAWLVATTIVVLSWDVISDRTMWMFVEDAHVQAGDLLGRMVPPRWSYLDKLWVPLWDTLNIATLGTLIAIVFGVPLAFLAARNTTPSRLLVRPVALFVIVASRSINSLIWALLLVSIIGPGVLAGVFAIAFRSVGFIGKLLYEALEEIDEGAVEAVQATGASRPQVIGYAMVPQIAPAFAGISVFRWDINIRESTVLGLVGAGGIGLQLEASISQLAWREASVVFVVILATVLASEWLSARIRHAII